MRYELWHVGSANLMDDFGDEAEAYDVVRAYLTPDDDGVSVDVALVIYDEAGNEIRSLHGDALASLVFGPSYKRVQRTA
ncbi:MAG: hypothetical protein U0893_09555 [Chloroflexota bacterium]